jgi:ribose transport system permease protein
MNDVNVIQYVLKQKVLLILIAMFIIASLISPYFLTPINISNLISQISIYGVIAFGATFVIIARELDLSVGAVLAFSGVFILKILPYTGTFLGIVIVLLSGALTGLLIGVLVTFLRLNSFLVTLCFMFIYNGLALVITGGRPMTSDNMFLGWLGGGSTVGIPNLIWIFVILFIVTHYILTRTRFGRNVYATGGDMHVAVLSGIPARFYKISVFVISSTSAALAGMLLTGMLNSGSPVAGGTVALTVVSAVVIGGTSLSGGEGGAVRSVIGIFIFGILENALSLINMPSFHQTLVKGILLVLVIGWDYYSRRVKVTTGTLKAGT